MLSDKQIIKDALRDGESITYGMRSTVVLIDYVKRLVAAVGELPCTGGGCDHAFKYHLDDSGCEVERGDGYRGAEFQEALGPCGCVGGSKEEGAVIALLREVKKEVHHAVPSL